MGQRRRLRVRRFPDRRPTPLLPNRAPTIGPRSSGARSSLGGRRDLRPTAEIGATRDARLLIEDSAFWSILDPGCVKTPKGRSRRGIVFYRRRGFRVVLQP